MKDKFTAFFNKWNGKYCEVNDPSNLYQCMDLSYAWCDFLQIPRDTIRHLYAYQVYTEPNDLTVKYFDFIPNTPSGIPPVGSLVVFSTAIGGVAGHISIATGEGDTNTFNSFDQNFGTDKHCRIVSHTYTALKGMGWLVPKEQGISDDTKRALEILEQYRSANTLGNLEATVRALVGLADDAVALKNELLEYKNGENLRIDSAVNKAITENNEKWQSDLNSASKTIQELKDKIEVLTLGQAESMTYSMLFSIAWKKWWSLKRG